MPSGRKPAARSRKCGWRKPKATCTAPEDVERALKTIFANFKNRLETIPTKYASTMAQLTDPAEAHDILQKAVQEALVELSDPEIALAAPAGEEPEDEQEE